MGHQSANMDSAISKALSAMLLNVIAIIVMLQHLCVDACAMEAFKQHLEFNRLQHAIIIHTTPMEAKDTFEKNLLNSFVSQYYVKFINTISNQKDSNQLLNRNTPRVGLFMHYSSTDQGKPNILLSASENENFNYSSSWFIVMANNTGVHLETIRQNMAHLNVMLNADVTVGMPKENGTLHLYDIYKICHKCGMPLEIKCKGIWTARSGLKIRKMFKDHFVTRRSNFKNATVNVATALLNYSPNLNMTPMEYLDNNKRYMQNDFMQRKTYQLLKMTQYLYNFSFHLQILDKWGALTNGTWTGVIALLQSNEVEFSVCPLRFLEERGRAMKYSPELHVEKIRFLLRHPKRHSIRNIFFEPLAVTVWWCVLALICITTFLLALHVHAECQHVREGKIHPVEKREPEQAMERNLDFIVLNILEAIFMQGPSPERFRSNSTRILLTSVSVFSVLLMQFYGAFIVSSLLSEPPRTITNLPALYNSSLEIGMENISYNFELFTTATNPVVRNIYKNRICRRGVPRAVTLEQGVKRIAKGGFALHVSLDRAYHLLENILTESQFCDLQEITFNTPFSSGVGLAKSSPYSKYISTAILKFRESSLLQYNDKRWQIHKIDCAAVPKDDVEVDLVHFAPLLVFLSFAILTAAWIFFAENLGKRIQRRIRMSFKYICKTMRKYLGNKQ